MTTRSRFVIFAVAVAGIALGAGRASAGSVPFDATGSGVGALAAPNVLAAAPFLLGEVDLSILGVPETELASVGLVGAAADSPGDGPNTLIVDDDAADCPDAAFTSIQAAVDAAGPGDQIKVCPGTYQEQVRIGPGKDGLLALLAGPAPGDHQGAPADDAAELDRPGGRCRRRDDPTIHDQRAVHLWGVR